MNEQKRTYKTKTYVLDEDEWTIVMDAMNMYQATVDACSDNLGIEIWPDDFKERFDKLHKKLSKFHVRKPLEECKECHDMKYIYASGMCEKCYMTHYRATHPEQVEKNRERMNKRRKTMRSLNKRL